MDETGKRTQNEIQRRTKRTITANNENFCVIFLTCHLPKNISFAANNA